MGLSEFPFDLRVFEWVMKDMLKEEEEEKKKKENEQKNSNPQNSISQQSLHKAKGKKFWLESLAIGIGVVTMACFGLGYVRAALLP